MKKIIKLQTTRLYNQSNIRRFEFTEQGLSLFISVKPRAQELLLDLLTLVSRNIDIDSVVVHINAKDLGFSSNSNLRKYRNELIERGLVFYDNNDYYINPVHINYYTRRQRDYFFRLFRLKSDIKVTMNNPTLIKMVK